MKNLIFELKNPVTVTTGGEEKEFYQINMKAPTARCASLCSILSSQFSKSQRGMLSIIKDIDQSEQGKEEKEEGSDEMTGEQVLNFLKMGGADLNKCFHALNELFPKTNATVNNGDVRATKDYTEEIPYYELERLLGEYIANFIATSS